MSSEREAEVEALEAIFGEEFRKRASEYEPHHSKHHSKQGAAAINNEILVFDIIVEPFMQTTDQVNRNIPSVSVILTFRLPSDYPFRSAPKISACRRRHPDTNELLGPSDAKVQQIRRFAADYAKEFIGDRVCVYDIVQAVRDKLVELNKPSVDLREEMLQRQLEMEIQHNERLKQVEYNEKQQRELKSRAERGRIVDDDRRRKLELELIEQRNARKRLLYPRNNESAAVTHIGSIGNDQFDDENIFRELSADDPDMLRFPQLRLNTTVLRERTLQHAVDLKKKSSGIIRDDVSFREEDIVFDENLSQTSVPSEEEEETDNDDQDSSSQDHVNSSENSSSSASETTRVVQHLNRVIPPKSSLPLDVINSDSDSGESISISDAEFNQANQSRLSTSLEDGDFLDHNMLSALGAGGFGIVGESRARQSLFFRQVLRKLLSSLRIGPRHFTNNGNASTSEDLFTGNASSSPTKLANALSKLLPSSVLSTSDLGKLFDPSDIARFRREFRSEIRASTSSSSSAPHARFWSALLSESVSVTRHQTNQSSTKTPLHSPDAAAPASSPLQRSVSNMFGVQISSRFQEDFQVLQKLGSGGFGSVVKCRNRLDGRVYAVKMVALTERDLSERRILREVMTLARLTHPNVVRYHQAWLERREAGDSTIDELFSGDISGTTALRIATANTLSQSDGDSVSEEIFARLYIQMEFCRSTLREFIDSVDDYGVDLWVIFRQIVEGLAHIHSRGICHRDLKPTNVFFDVNGNIKIGDFGLAMAVGKTEDLLDTSILSSTNAAATKSEPNMHRISSEHTCASAHSHDEQTRDVGTFFYRAPEVESTLSTSQRSLYSSKVDLYSLGIIAWEMWHGPCATHHERYQKIMKLRERSSPPDESFCEAFPMQTRLIQALLSHDPQLRPSAADLLTSEQLIPPRMEDEYVHDILRQVSIPGSKLRTSVLDVLFHYSEEDTDRKLNQLSSHTTTGISGTRTRISFPPISPPFGPITGSPPRIPLHRHMRFGACNVDVDLNLNLMCHVREKVYSALRSVCTQRGAVSYESPQLLSRYLLVSSTELFMASASAHDILSNNTKTSVKSDGWSPTPLLGLSKSKTHASVCVLAPPAGEHVMLRRDLRTWFSHFASTVNESSLKRIEIGSVWLPLSGIHTNMNSATPLRDSIDEFPKLSTTASHSTSHVLSTSPDLSAFLLGLTSTDDVTRTRRSESAASHFESCSQVIGELDFILPTRWAACEAEAIKSTLDFADRIRMILESSITSSLRRRSSITFSIDSLRIRYSLRLGHLKLTTAVLCACQVDPERANTIAGVLSQTPYVGWKVVRKCLLEECGLSKTIVEQLASFALLRGRPLPIVCRLIRLLRYQRSSSSATARSSNAKRMTRVHDLLQLKTYAAYKVKAARVRQDTRAAVSELELLMNVSLESETATVLDELFGCLNALEHMNVDTDEILLDSVLTPPGNSDFRPPFPQLPPELSSDQGSFANLAIPSGSYNPTTNASTASGSSTAAASASVHNPSSSLNAHQQSNAHDFIDSSSEFTPWGGVFFELIFKFGGRPSHVASGKRAAGASAGLASSSSAFVDEEFGVVGGNDEPNLGLIPPVTQIIAHGGEWSHLLRAQKKRLLRAGYDVTECGYAYGVTFELEKIISLSMLVISQVLGPFADGNTNCDVFVCEKGNNSSEHCEKLLYERISIVSELWNNGIRAQYLYKMNPSIQEQLELAVQSGASWIITIRLVGIEHNEQLQIKVKSLFGQKKSEMDVQRSDLLRYFAFLTPKRNPPQ